MSAIDELAAEIPRTNRIPFEAPWGWLAKGWQDIRRVPGISLTYGAIFTFVSLLLVLGLFFAGGLYLILPLAGGFLLLGPIIAVGLYETSRRLEEGEPVSFADIVTFSTRSPGQLAFMGAALLIVYFAWLDIALLLFMLFIGPTDLPPIDKFVPMLLLTWNGLGLLIVGTMVGAALALLVFAVTAVSIPLLMRRRIDVVTAAATSVQAVLRNPLPMGLWAILIAGMMAVAFAALFVGMVVVFPLVGHATWHAYREVVPPLQRPRGRGSSSGQAARRPRSPATPRRQDPRTGRTATPKGKRPGRARQA